MRQDRTGGGRRRRCNVAEQMSDQLRPIGVRVSREVAEIGDFGRKAKLEGLWRYVPMRRACYRAVCRLVQVSCGPCERACDSC